MRRKCPVSESEKPLTEAEKQVLRLEQLRAQKEQDSKASAEKTYLPSKTMAEKTAQKLQAMKQAATKSKALKSEQTKRLPKIDGKMKSAKLSHLQIAVLERLKGRDKKLRSGAVIRIALNRLFDI